MPDVGLARSGMYEVAAETDERGELQRRRRPEQERICRFVDGCKSCERRSVDDAADAIVTLENGDGKVRVLLREFRCCSKASDPCADDDDVVRVSIARGHAQTAVTRCASARMTSESSFTHAVRSKASPCFSACTFASMSRS